jgi:hypothetical protein
MSFRSVACALLVSGSCLAAYASPGDPFVPAHRTRDGHYVPPNVPPLSAGTHLARHPGSGATVHKAPRQPPAAGTAPSYADARPVAR